MSSITAVDAGLLLLRVGLGAVMIAHGYNHIFGGGKIAGTARLSIDHALGIFQPPGWARFAISIGAGLRLLWASGA